HRTRVGAVTLAGLPSAVQAGLFAASPGYSVTLASLGGGSMTGGPTLATGAFDHVRQQGAWPAGRWTGDAIGDPDVPSDSLPPSAQGFRQSGGALTVSGSGDIAPAVRGSGSFGGQTLEHVLAGTFAGLI